MPRAFIPQHDVAAAILTFRDGAFKAAVFEGMIFDVHGEALVGRIETWAFGDRPAVERAVELKTENRNVTA